jgi:hypothetical protein
VLNDHSQTLMYVYVCWACSDHNRGRTRKELCVMSCYLNAGHVQCPHLGRRRNPDVGVITRLQGGRGKVRSVCYAYKKDKPIEKLLEPGISTKC